MFKARSATPNMNDLRPAADTLASCTWQNVISHHVAHRITLMPVDILLQINLSLHLRSHLCLMLLSFSLSLSVCTRQLRSNSLQSSISSRICRIVMPQCSGQTSIHAPFLRAFGVHVGSPSLTQACSSICSQILARWL